MKTITLPMASHRERALEMARQVLHQVAAARDGSQAVEMIANALLEAEAQGYGAAAGYIANVVPHCVMLALNEQAQALRAQKGGGGS